MNDQAGIPNPQHLLLHQDFVRNLAWNILHDEHAAEDVAQNTWLRFFRARPALDAGSKFWFGRVARNLSVDELRARDRMREAQDALPQREAAPSAADVLAREAIRKQVVDAVLALPERYRAAILLRYFDNLPPREIAKRLSMPVETVRTQIKRGLECLREAMDSAYEGDRKLWSSLLLPCALPKTSNAALAAVASVGVVAAGLLLSLFFFFFFFFDSSVEEGLDSSSMAQAVPSLAQPTDSMPDAEPSPFSSRAVLEEAPSEVPELKAEEKAVVAIPESKALRGVVRDLSGQPVFSALVYRGNQARMRGDELFKPFQEQRIADGVRTDASGRFEIRGEGEEGELTVFHPEHGPVTVAVAESMEIQLPPRGNIDGTVLDAQSAPVSNWEVFLDRTRSAFTDGAGKFRFDGVEPGIRGLSLEKQAKQFIAAKVHPGKTTTVSIVPGYTEASLAVFSAEGKPLPGKIDAMLLSSGDVGAMYAFKTRDGQGTVPNLRPGRYLLSLQRHGFAVVEVSSANVSVQLNALDLTVQADPGTRLFLFPGEWRSELTELLAARMSLTVPAEGKVRFSGLFAGKYFLGIDKKGVLRSVEITEPGEEISIQPSPIK